MSRVTVLAVVLLFTLPASAQDVDALAKELGSPDHRTRSKAMMALVKMGPAGAQALLKGLDHESALVRATAAGGFTQLGANRRDPAEGLPRLIELLEDEDRAVRLAAATALMYAGANRVPEKIEALGKLLRDPDSGVVHQAVQTLLFFKGKAQPVLLAALEDPKAQAHVARGLQRSKDEHLDALWAEAKGSARFWLATAFASRGKEPAATVKTLMDGLFNGDAQTREVALKWLGNMREHSRGPLREALADSDTARQLWAALALARCDEKGPAIKKVLVKSLKAKGDERYLAAIELARQKEINKTVLKTLIGGVKSAASVETRVATARALGGVEPIPKKAVSALTKGCKADAPQVRSACLAALHLAKPAPKGLMKLALKAAGDDEPEVRASAMARMAYGDDRTISKRVKALTKGLDDSEPKVRRNAIQSLSRIGKPAASAAKRLEELAAGDPDLGVQTTAKNALERIQRGGR